MIAWNICIAEMPLKGVSTEFRGKDYRACEGLAPGSVHDSMKVGGAGMPWGVSTGQGL